MSSARLSVGHGADSTHARTHANTISPRKSKCRLARALCGRDDADYVHCPLRRAQHIIYIQHVQTYCDANGDSVRSHPPPNVCNAFGRNSPSSNWRGSPPSSPPPSTAHILRNRAYISTSVYGRTEWLHIHKGVHAIYVDGRRSVNIASPYSAPSAHRPPPPSPRPPSPCVDEYSGKYFQLPLHKRDIHAHYTCTRVHI